VVPFLYWIVARRSPGWVQIGGAVLAAAGRPAAFGLVFGMDVLSWRFVAGPALILTGVIVIEALPGRRDAPNPAAVLPRAD
jgi:drug/metabolite transporter (DMT)-like permease